jgi:hypothetical protein
MGWITSGPPNPIQSYHKVTIEKGKYSGRRDSVITDDPYPENYTFPLENDSYRFPNL